LFPSHDPKGLILYVDTNTIELTRTGSSGAGANDEAEGSGELLIRNTAQIQSLDLKYNLSPTEANTFANSFDGGNMIFNSFPVISSAETMTAGTGSVRNWLLEEWNPTVELSPLSTDYQVPSDYTQEDVIQPFSVQEIPYVTPWWNEGLAEEYEENIAPDDFIGDNTLKGLFEVKCWRTLQRDHNPITFQFEMEGAVGWYDENGNGGVPTVEIGDVTYYNVSQAKAALSLDIQDINRVTFRVNKTTGGFASSDKFSVYVAKKQDFNTYNQSKVNHGLTYLYTG